LVFKQDIDESLGQAWDKFEAYTKRAHSQKKGILKIQSQDALLAQNKIMTQQLETLVKKLS